MLLVIVLYIYEETISQGLIDVIGQFKFLTRWGEWFTFFAMLAGSNVSNHSCKAIEDLNDRGF